MKVNAYLLANKSQAVQIPIPVDPVPVTITPSNTIGAKYNARHYSYAPVADVDFSNNLGGTPHMQDATTSGEYYVSLGGDCPPCNASVNGDGEQSLYFQNSALWNGRHYVADELNVYTTGGSFTVDVSSLPAGKYCFEIVHYIGMWDNTKWSGTDVYLANVQVVGNKKKVVKNGTHGIIYGQVFPDVETHAGYNYSQYQDAAYKGRMICAVVRYAFEVSAGDTTKVFAWGDDTDISLRDLWNSVKLYQQNSDMTVWEMANWVNTHFTWRAKLYTAL